MRRVAFAAVVLLALLPLVAPHAQAQQVRAWLDRDRIALGETATLNIEVEGTAAEGPDYSPLLGEFRLGGQTSRRSFEVDNGKTSARTLFGVQLQPRQQGTLEIPRLLVAGTRTEALTLLVTAPASTPARAGDDVFIESEADTQAPYVQQSVGYVVRLYFAVPLVNGSLEQPEPEGATMQRVGEDLRYAREIDGKRYTVVERRFLLVPERSGTLALPGAYFRGRSAGGFFDGLFGDGQRALHANGAPRVLGVRPVPANAPQPWLPLHSLSLRWKAAPGQAQAGAATTLVLEATADGATAAQLPELQLPPIAGAQVFPDPPDHDEAFTDGRPQTTVRRRFAIVPVHSGALRISAPTLQWWDADAGVARTASAPALQLQVAAAAVARSSSSATPPRDAATAPADAGWMRVPGVQGRVRPWAFTTVAFALLWLITFMWGLHRRPQVQADAEPGRKPARLRQALDTGDLGDVAEALCASMSPPAPDLDAVREALVDERQRAAVDALQQARWGAGDGSAARALLREAFARGPRWAAATKTDGSPLPPLYPVSGRTAATRNAGPDGRPRRWR
ncbi:MAG: BatD family protein [Pseudomonadota bacterium]|nr:BatD family protein [Pseudomonadota bacterium]